MKTLLFFAVCFMAFAFGTHAQRVANLQAYMISPDSGHITTMNCVDSYFVQTGFVNLGPGVLYPTDTISFLDAFSEDDMMWVMTPSDTLKVGDTIVAEPASYYHMSDLQSLLDASGNVVSAPFSNGNYYFFSTFYQYGAGVISPDVSSNDNSASIAVAPITINCAATAIHDVALNNTVLKVFPNPAYDQLSVTGNFTASGNASILITDVTGRVIESKNLGAQSAGVKTFNMDISGLKSSVYYIELITDQSKGISKFIKN